MLKCLGLSTFFKTNYVNKNCCERAVSLGTKIVKMPFYAVASGKSTGIFDTWAECESQVKGFKGAKFKKFNTRDEAQAFVMGGKSFSTTNNVRAKKADTVKNVKPVVKAKPTSLTAASSSTNHVNDDFENIDDLHSELMKKMDEIENDIGAIKKNAFGVRSSKRTLLIDPLPINNSTSEVNKNNKRPSDNLAESGSKRKKTLSVIKGKDNYHFDVDENGYVEVYTDGACSNNGYDGAKAGLGVYFGENHPLNVSEPVSGRPTNNCGEIQAATKAIRIAHSLGINKLNIKTDSKFVINSITKWISGWKRKGWKLANGEPVKNEIDFKELDEAQKLVTINWEYVNAHKGILGNERADQLAKSGATKYRNKV